MTAVHVVNENRSTDHQWDKLYNVIFISNIPLSMTAKGMATDGMNIARLKKLLLGKNGWKTTEVFRHTE